jgi:phage terminase large subunit-like protein
LPKGIVASEYPSTEQVCRRIGIVFDPWEADLNRCLLGKSRNGLYAADTALLSIPRQVGKTFDIGSVVFADSIKRPGTTTVWTAHRFKVARESFNEMRGWAKSPLLKQHIEFDDITTAAGNECIPFRNGSRIMFAARERGAVRGFTKVRRLVLDEAQILTDAALADLVPTMNQAFNPQVVMMCTPPKPSDPSEVAARLREEALTGASDGVLYVELSAPRDCDPGDRAAWRKANPSYPKRTPAKAILRMRKLLSPEDFRREALGIWDEAADAWQVISQSAWLASLDASSVPGDPVCFAADAMPGGLSASIGIAGRRADGLMHVEVPSDLQRPGTAWVVPRLLELTAAHPTCGVVVDPAGQAGSLISELEQAGVQVLKPAARDAAQACGQFFEAVTDSRTVRHRGDEALMTALGGAVTRPLADAWAWARRSAVTDISPLVAVTLAAWGHNLTAPVANAGVWII